MGHTASPMTSCGLQSCRHGDVLKQILYAHLEAVFGLHAGLFFAAILDCLDARWDEFEACTEVPFEVVADVLAARHFVGKDAGVLVAVDAGVVD